MQQQMTEPGRFVAGGFRPYGFMTEREAFPDPMMVTRHTVWQDSLGRYWNASGRLPFGAAPYRWVLAEPVTAKELAAHDWSARLAAIAGTLATVILVAAGFIIGWFHAPLWLVIAPLAGATATAHITAYHAGRASHRRDGMIVIPASTNGAS